MIAVLLLCLLGQAEPTPAGRPLAYERYDELIVCEEPIDPQAPTAYRRREVAFVRGGVVIATRTLDDEFAWGESGGRVVLRWDDYGQGDRIVEAERLRWCVRKREPTVAAPTDVPWWGQQRRMTDLRPFER